MMEIKIFMILIIFSIFSIECYRDPDYYDFEDSDRRHHRRDGRNNLRYYAGSNLAQPQKSKSKPQFGIIKPGTNQPEHFANAFEAGVGVAKSVRDMSGVKGLEEFARGVNSLLQNSPAARAVNEQRPLDRYDDPLYPDDKYLGGEGGTYEGALSGRYDK